MHHKKTDNNIKIWVELAQNIFLGHFIKCETCVLTHAHAHSTLNWSMTLVTQ